MADDGVGAGPAPVEHDGPDFHKYEALFAEHSKEIASFPSEVLSVNEEKKELRALDRTLFEDTSANYGFVAFSKAYLAQEWSVMSMKSDNSKLKTKTAMAAKLPEQIFEVDEASLITSEQGTEQKASLQRWMTDDGEASTKDDASPILPLVNVIASPAPVQVVPAAHPYQERLGEEVAIEATELTFGFGNHEPFFCTLALYDGKEKRKISEDFVFQINSPAQLALANIVEDRLTPTVRAKKCIFRLSQTSKHAQIYAFLQVSKVLSGDLDKAYEMYAQTQWKDKDLKKALASIHETCGRLSKFRQVFAWGCAPIFEPDGSYRSESIYSMELSRVKTDMWSLIEEVALGKKIKAIPGMFKFLLTVKPNPATFVNRLTPCLAQVQPFDAATAANCTKEVQEFTSTNEYPYPWVNYVNNYYVYLQKADLSSLSGRNIMIEVKFMDDDSDPEAAGLPIIYADASTSSGALISTYLSTVTYHNDVPKLLDEIAIKLPTQVTEKHHLLVSFYHISVAEKKGSSEDPRNLVARTFIPLLKDHQIIRQKNTIRIATKLAPGYMTKEEAVTWIDNKKAALTIYARVISSVYPLEGALHKFLRTCEWDQSEWTKIIGAMHGLFDEKTNRRQIIRYIPIVMRTLFQHLMSSSAGLSREAFDTLLAILDSVSTLTKPEDGILEAYLTFVFNEEANLVKAGASNLYQRLIEQWQSVISDRGEAKIVLSLKYSWFLIGVVLKSILYTLTPHVEGDGNVSDDSAAKSHGRKGSVTAESKAKLDMKIEPKKAKLGPEWVRLMANFARACADFVHESHKNVTYQAHLPSFHVQMARLMGDTIPLMEKGASFEIIWDYFSTLNLANIDMFTYKALMMKVWIQRVDFAAINIPVLPNFTSVRDIPHIFLQRHFLVGLLLKQLEFAYVTNNHAIRILILDLLTDALYTHEADPRLSSKQRTKIIQAYFPFVLMVIDRFDILKMAPEDEKAKSYAILLVILRNISQTFLASYWRKEAERRIFALFELLSSLAEQFEWIGHEETVEYVRQHPALQNPRFSLVALVGGVTDEDVVLTSDSRGTLARQMSIGPRGPGVTPTPSHKPTKKKITVHSPRSSTPSSSSAPATPTSSTPEPDAVTSAKTNSGTASLNSSSGAPPKEGSKEALKVPSKPDVAGDVSPRKGDSRRISVSVAKPKESRRNMKKAEPAGNKEILCAANLSYQTGVVVLDVLNTFITHFDAAMQRRDVFEQVFHVLIYLLRRHQSVAFLSILQKRLFFLVAKYGVRLFQKRNSVLGDLVTEVLNKCNSRVVQTRSEGATVLSQIFKVNFKLAGNVDRARLQATIGITKLVGQSSTDSFGRLFDVFDMLTKYFASEEKAIGSVVTSLETKIRTIITDNLKIQQFEYDPETIVDLYYGISKQLLDHPDERITWLDNLADYHRHLGQFEESAQTKILIAALVQQYLSALGRWEAKMVPVFGLVCPSVSEETDMPDYKALETLKGDICQASIFTSTGFAEIVRQAIEMFKQAGLLELAVNAYRMLLPIYQMSEDYKSQQLCHGDLYTLTGQLNDETQMKQRIFSNYYRVSLFGKKLGTDLDGQTFIYREKNTCRLAEFTDRIKNQFARPYGDISNVVIVPNAQVVDRATLDESKCYLQIATVELFLTAEQQAERTTPFKQHFGANRFGMEQPFTKNAGSKVHSASIEDQWLRRTVYVTKRAFPFALKRFQVSSTEEQELSPIEYAESLISKKVQQLRGEMSVATPNLKTLQRELQGTLLTQVNAGAGAIIQTFLSNGAKDKFPQEQREKLADITIEFDRALIFATKLNKKFMEPTADQTLLQEELEKGHERFHQSLEECDIIGERHAARRNQAQAAQQEQAALANRKLDGPSMEKLVDQKDSKFDAPKKSRSVLMDSGAGSSDKAAKSSSRALSRPSTPKS